MKIRTDYAKPFFKREETIIESVVNSKIGFALFIILIILAGAEF